MQVPEKLIAAKELLSREHPTNQSPPCEPEFGRDTSSWKTNENIPYRLKEA